MGLLLLLLVLLLVLLVLLVLLLLLLLLFLLLPFSFTLHGHRAVQVFLLFCVWTEV